MWSLQVSRPYMFDDRFLKGAEERYKGFLYLIKKNRDNFVNHLYVPTYDVDLMWHSHQLQPIAYMKDMLNLLGKVLEHDDMDTSEARVRNSTLDLQKPQDNGKTLTESATGELGLCTKETHLHPCPVLLFHLRTLIV